MMRKFLRFAALAASVAALGACDLAIDNPTAGDTKKVLGTPNDAEALISTYYKRWMSGVYGSTTDLEGMANVMSMMNYSSLANNCQNNHAPFANAANGNTPGNVCAGEQARLYQFMNEVNRVSSNFLNQMDNGLTLGSSPDPTVDSRNVRARAWAEFLRGISLGMLALMHDSASIVSPKMGTAQIDCLPDAFTGVCIGALRPYTEVMDSAYAALARSLAYTNTPTATLVGPDGFPIDNGTWLPSTTTWSTGEFTKLIRTYRARFRSQIARTPAERAAADWNLILADATNGITADHIIITSTTTGPSLSWRNQYESYTTWHQMPPFFIGMADTSGSYNTWINTALSNRGAGNTGFIMATPDLRFPQGVTRAQQQSDFAISSCAPAATPCKRYFVNRPSANDQYSGAGWGWSNYDFVRFHSWNTKGDANAARNGQALLIPVSEVNLIAAEAQYRLGNLAAAATLVNLSRTAPMKCFSGTCLGGTATGTSVFYAVGGGLPAAVAVGPVPGGNACVPKVPNSAGVVSCGDLWEALKYEKRIETAYVGYAPWFLDGRGWGDLAKDTPLFWPVPYQDLQARGRTAAQLYGTGPGVGNAPNSTAAGSTYGW